MKKFLSLLLAITMFLTMLSTVAFAESKIEHDGKTYDLTNEHPWIFVHGMGGWSKYGEEAYWGGWASSEGDVIDLFNSNGIEAYAAVVGPFNSAWDRACELYAQLTGTVVDYGEAHSKEHNHERYGYDYTGKPLMGEAWDMKEKINLVGHSFGGHTVRLFASLMAYGDEAEIAATGENTSPLFKGDHGDSIYSVITFSGVHNGSPVANLIHDSFLMTGIIGLLNFAGAIFGSNVLMWEDLFMGHMGLTPKQNEEKAKFSFETIKTAVEAQDNCGYDLTLRGSRELNEKIKTVDTAYYYSYVCNSTYKTSSGKYLPIMSNFAMFYLTSLYIGSLEGKTIDGIYMDETWTKNDGIVPYASALYPETDKDNAKSYEEAVKSGEKLETGVWYYMPVMEGFDHFDFCGTIDYPTSFEDFYYTLVETINHN